MKEKVRPGRLSGGREQAGPQGTFRVEAFIVRI